MVEMNVDDVPLAVAVALDFNRMADEAITRYVTVRTSYAEGYMDGCVRAWEFVMDGLTEDEQRLYVRLREAEGGGQ